jgi:hypothetical protein
VGIAGLKMRYCSRCAFDKTMGGEAGTHSRCRPDLVLRSAYKEAALAGEFKWKTEFPSKPTDPESAVRQITEKCSIRWKDFLPFYITIKIFSLIKNFNGIFITYFREKLPIYILYFLPKFLSKSTKNH